MDTLTRLVHLQERHPLVGPVQHPKFRLSILTARPFYSAGGNFTGSLKIQCKANNIGFRNLKVELVGFEETSRPGILQRDLKRHLFAKFHCNIPDSQHLLSKVIEPDQEGFFEADRGEYMVPFEMQLSMKLPTSTEPDRIKRPVAVRYLAVGSIDLKLPNGQYLTVTQSNPVIIYEKLQLRPELRVKLAETPQAAESFHTLPGSSVPVFLHVSIAKVIWVSGSILSAKLTLRNALKRRVGKIHIELLEDAKTFKNSDLVFDEDFDEGIEDESCPEGSTTLVDADISRATSLLSDAANLDTFSRVASKRTLGGNTMPAQVDLENEERKWNLQLMVPLDSHTIQRTRFSSITYRIRVSIGFFLAKQISVELPVLIVHPLALDSDPYQNLRDGVLLTTPHAFNDGHKYRVYEQPMDGIGRHFNSTSVTEHLAIKQMKEIHPTISPVDTAGGSLFTPSTVSPFSSEVSPNRKPPSQESLEPKKNPNFPDDEIPISRQSTIQTMTTAPNSPRKAVVMTKANLRAHRRAHSEAAKNSFFFQTSTSGELPQINSNWDWLDKRPEKVELSPITPPMKNDRTTHPAQKVLDDPETVFFEASSHQPLTKIDSVEHDDASSKYTVKFPVDPNPKFPWRNQAVGNRRRAFSLHSASMSVEDIIAKLPIPPTPRSEISGPSTPSTLADFDFMTSSPEAAALASRRSRHRDGYHPEVVARKYSFPPKPESQPPRPESPNLSPSSQPLKSALAKHKRSHTYGGSSKVRFAMDSGREFTPSQRPLATPDKTKETKVNPYRILSYIHPPPLPNNVKILALNYDPPIPAIHQSYLEPTSLSLSKAVSETPSDSSSAVSSFMFSVAEEMMADSPEMIHPEVKMIPEVEVRPEVDEVGPEVVMNHPEFDDISPEVDVTYTESDNIHREVDELSDDSGIFETPTVSFAEIKVCESNDEPISRPVIAKKAAASPALSYLPSPKVMMVLSPRPRARWRESFKWRSKTVLPSQNRMSTPSYSSTLVRRTAGWEDLESGGWTALEKPPSNPRSHNLIDSPKPRLKQD